jgi:hypothetical protein
MSKQAFRTKKTLVVTKDTTIENYQNLVNEENRRKRDHFRSAQVFHFELRLLHDFKHGSVAQFAIEIKDEKDNVIDTMFVQGKMPNGLEDSRAYGELLKNAKFESVPVSPTKVRNYSAIPLCSSGN